MARTTDRPPRFDGEEPTRRAGSDDSRVPLSSTARPAAGSPVAPQGDVGIPLVVGIVLGLGVLVVHDVAGMLSRPFWYDEAWVAASTRVPLSELADVTASTPTGFAVLLRPLSGLGDQVPRLSALFFAGAAVVMASVLAGTLPWATRQIQLFASCAAGLVVLLVPASLMRNDLKQYTADAFFCLLAIWLCSCCEATSSRRALAGLTVLTGLGPLISVGASLTGMACFAGLVVLRMGQRRWVLVKEATLAAVAAGLVMAFVYSRTLGQGVSGLFYDFWRDYFLDGSPSEILSTIWTRLGERSAALGLGSATLLLVALFATGLVALVTLERVAVCLAVSFLWVGMIILGVADRYPFLDLRTSHFLLLLTATVCSIGVSALAGALARRWRLAPAAVGIGVLALWLPQVDQNVRDLGLPNEDVRSQTRYVSRNIRPGDVVLVSSSSNYGFAYYWPDGEVSVDERPYLGPGFLLSYPGDDDIVVADDRRREEIEPALRAAVDRARQASGRIWVVRTHMVGYERKAWFDAAAALGLTIDLVCMDTPEHEALTGREVCPSPEPLGLIEVGPG
jgi:hypothetical protein